METIETETIILELWPVERAAVLFMPGGGPLRFAAAIGYDAELGTCDELHLYNRAADAWNHADPSICEALSAPVTRSALRSAFSAVGYAPTEAELAEFERASVRTFAGAEDPDGLACACKWAYEHGFAEKAPV